MAMKAMRCPQCGSDLELDDTKDFGFCSSCGTKVMLHETVEMKHTGDVRMKLDNSDQGRNRIALGNRAFASGNYDEAYEYYTKGLEDQPEDVVAISRKGICAVYMSPDDNIRLGELQQALLAANEILSEWVNSAEKDSDEAKQAWMLVIQLDDDLQDLCAALLQGTDQYFAQMDSVEKCHHQAATWCECVKLLNVVTEAVFDEEIRETLLQKSVARCDFWLGLDKGRKITHYTHTTRNKNGQAKNHYSNYSMGETRLQIIKNARADMAERYNSLPGRLEREQGMKDALESLQGESDQLKAVMDQAQAAYDNAKDQFWNNNPELTARRNKNKNLSWISVGVGAVILLVTVLMRSTSSALPVAGVAALAASFYARSKMAKSMLAKLEKEAFPEDVKALQEALSGAQSSWVSKERERREKQGEISAFESSKK